MGDWIAASFMDVSDLIAEFEVRFLVTFSNLSVEPKFLTITLLLAGRNYCCSRHRQLQRGTWNRLDIYIGDEHIIFIFKQMQIKPHVRNVLVCVINIPSTAGEGWFAWASHGSMGGCVWLLCVRVRKAAVWVRTYARFRLFGGAWPARLAIYVEAAEEDIYTDWIYFTTTYATCTLTTRTTSIV